MDKLNQTCLRAEKNIHFRSIFLEHDVMLRKTLTSFSVKMFIVSINLIACSLCENIVSHPNINQFKL